MAEPLTELPPEPVNQPRWLGALSSTLAALLTLAALGWAADIYRSAGLILIDEQFNAFVLAFAVALVFLIYRRRRGTVGPPPWYDIVAAVVGAAAALYVSYNYQALADAIAYRPLNGSIVGGILLVLVLEGLRRVSGNVLTFILLVFIGYGLFGHLLPGELQGRHVAPDGLLIYLAVDANGVFGSVFGIAATVVVCFLFFGALLARSGGAQFFTEIAISALGQYRGGAAKISIIASSLFGTISGNAVSNVVATGVVTIPMMKQSGYKPEHAGAIEAVSSTGGQLMPPIMGAAAFIMAELIGTSYASVVIAATVPALLYYGALFIQADLEAAKSKIAAVPRSQMRPIGEVLKEGWYFPIPFAVIIYALFWLNMNPDGAALYASLDARGLRHARQFPRPAHDAARRPRLPRGQRQERPRHSDDRGRRRLHHRHPQRLGTQLRADADPDPSRRRQYRADAAAGGASSRSSWAWACRRSASMCCWPRWWPRPSSRSASRSWPRISSCSTSA